LKTESTLNNKGLQRKISSTQRLVEKSVDIVHRFARDLRPTVLDDLGLIPALHSFLKTFTTRTGVRASLATFTMKINELDAARRTALFRVAQEALTNVARHAHASRVEVSIQKLPDWVSMKIKDDGKSFNVDRALRSNGGKHLGLVGMRERLEMIGGKFVVESAPGKGTTILAQIPIGKARARGGGKSADEAGSNRA
jgi:signal transduction histidine kinase